MNMMGYDLKMILCRSFAMFLKKTEKSDLREFVKVALHSHQINFLKMNLLFSSTRNSNDLTLITRGRSSSLALVYARTVVA